jgi:hypothetical protein
MWGGSGAQASTKPQSIKEQRQVLDDILGGDSIDFGAPVDKPRSQTMAPSKTDFDMLKNLYNTSSVAQNQPMYNNQPDYFNTGAVGGGAGYGGMDYSGAGYNQNYGGAMGYGAQPQYYNTGYGGYGAGATGYGAGTTGYGAGATGYGAGATGYGAGATGYGAGATGYGAGATGYGAGATGYGGYATGTYGATAGYGEGNSMNTGYGQQTGFNTSVPKSSTNNKDYDPFS